MKIQGIDHIEFYVGDLRRWADDLTRAYGFRIYGHAGPATGMPGQDTLLLRQGRAQLLLTTPLSQDHPAATYLRRHGDGAAVIAFGTDDVRGAFGEAVAGGAAPLAGPAFASGDSDSGGVGTASVSGFGDVVHKLVERTGPADDFAPGAMVMTPPTDVPTEQAEDLFQAVDHIAVCLRPGRLGATVRLYQEAFGLSEIFDERIEVGGQAMLSKVVQDSSREVTFTLIEPDLTREPGQIDEFLTAHGGAGVQHVALRTRDIAAAVRLLAGRGVEFLTTPAAYYESLEGRLGVLGIPAGLLRELNVLADTDRYGEMFQIFARSTHERNTYFFELIERRGALTFGSRNIKALYEAVERRRTAASPPAQS
jgi:4-hydroxymandelate synthase